MRYVFTPMDEETAREIRRWRYEGAYAAYTIGNADRDITEEVDRRSPYYAVHGEEELVGFFAFGISVEVSPQAEPGLFGPDHSLTIGLGLRPDLTGAGRGASFVAAGLEFARHQFAPASFRLYVLSWNERAIRVYERVGFTRSRVLVQRNAHGESEFVEMTRPA